MAFSIKLSSLSASALSCPQACKGCKLFNGLHSVNFFSANGYTPDLALLRLGSRSLFGIKSVGKIRAAVVSGEGDLLNKAVANGALLGDKSVEIEAQPDAIAFGTLAADTAPIATGFPIDNDEFDLDCPTEGFSSIPEAIEDIRQGKMLVVVDDEDRENEGDLIMAAEFATSGAMAFIVKHGTGIVCATMKEEDLERLQLPLMVNQKENEEKLRTAFTVTVGLDLRAEHEKYPLT